MTTHTLSVLVENKPGVLARTTSLFARRGFTIDSVSEGTTQDPAVSRITIVVDADVCPLTQVVRQIGKLVNGLKVAELEPAAAIRRELVLVKVRACHDTRSQVVDLVKLFRARIVDVSPQAVTIAATGTRDKLDALLAMLGPFGITELVQSGTVAIGRGPDTLSAPSHAAPSPAASYPSPAPSRPPVPFPNQGESPWPTSSTTTTPTFRSSRAVRSR